MRRTAYGFLGFATAIAAAWMPSRSAACDLVMEPPLIGVSVPSKVAAVAPEQAGKIRVVPVIDGDLVKKDDVLFELNSRLEELEVERLRPLAESDLIKLRALESLRRAEQQEGRVRDLRDKQISSGSDLEAQEFEVAVAKLRMQQAGMEQEQAKNELAQAIERLAQRTVRSPFDGVVTQRMKSEGESIEKFVPVIEVMCLDPLWIEFDCPVTERQLFALGSEVDVRPAQYDELRKATVVHVSDKANASSHTFLVRAAVPNPDRTWKTGLKMLIQRPADPTVPAKPGK